MEERWPGQPRAADFHEEEDKGRREKEETQDLDVRKVPMMEDQMMMNEGLWRDQELMSPSSYGSLFKRLVVRSFILSCNSPLNSLRTTLSTSKQHAEASQTLLNAQSSPTNSGSHSSQEKLLISTQSLQLTTPPWVMKSKLTKYLKGLLYDSPKIVQPLRVKKGHQQCRWMDYNLVHVLPGGPHCVPT